MEGTSDRAVVAALLRLSAIPKDDWEQCIQEVLQVDAQVLGLGRVSYWSLRADPTLLHCEMGYVARPHAFERGLEILAAQHPSYFDSLAAGEVIEIEDVHEDRRTADLSQYLHVRGIVSMLDIPVWSQGRIVGLLCHEHVGSKRRWSAADLEFATAVAQTVAAAIEAHARGEAEQSQRAAMFLDRVSRRIASARDVPHAAERALACVVPDLAEWGVVDVYQRGRVVRVAVAHRTPEGRHLIEEITRRFPPHAGGPHLTTQAIGLRQAVLIPELSRVRPAELGIDREHARLLRSLGSRSVIAAPLAPGDRVLGAVLLGAVDRSYDQADLRLFEEFAYRLALAIENAHLHAEAKDAIRARDEFIALAAHELHGPLGSLQLAAESLARRVTANSPDAIVRMSETVLRQARRLNRLVDHMLDAARVMSNRLSIAPEPIDLGALVAEIAQSFGERAARAGSALQCELQPNVIGTWDGDRLTQVIGNLLDNAVKFGRGQPITIVLCSNGERALLSVRDEGIGIPIDRLPTIFDRFERAVSVRSFGGLGLGLFTAKAIVEAHGGTIGVQSEPDRGTTFTVALPLGARVRAAGKGGGS